MSAEHNLRSIHDEWNNINVSYFAQKLKMKTTIIFHHEILQLCYHHYDLDVLEMLVNVAQKRVNYKIIKEREKCQLFAGCLIIYIEN